MKMKLLLNTFLKRGFCSTRLVYEIPDEYHNSFYLANATLLQIVNYFIHSSYQTVFPELVEKVKTRLNCSSDDAVNRTRMCIHRLDRCESMVDLHIPLKRYHGGYTIIKANRAYHGLTYYNKSLGGLRFDPELLRHNSQGFAVQGTYRNALFGIEMGGASGGIKMTSYVLDPTEVYDLLASYLSRMPKFDNLIDIMEPDFGTTHTEMDMLKRCEDKAPHILTMGKSEDHGGHVEHLRASGRCAMQCIKQFLEHKNVMKHLDTSGELANKTYILQGLGKVGQQLAHEMHREGAKCVGVREHDCIIYEPAGIHIKALLKHNSKYGTIRGFSPKGREYDLDSIFAQSCDILVLAAVERCISCNIADKILAKVIVEVANLPITPTAYKILIGKSKLVIPGILAGAGPTLISYFEYRMSVEANKLDARNVPSLFNASLVSVIDEVIDIEEQLNLKFNYLHAAYVHAIRNLFKRIIDSHVLLEKTNQKMIGMQ